MIAIHKSVHGFHPRWVAYCQEKGIPFKQVDCYANNLIEQLKDCKALLWHFSQNSSNDIIIAKQILFALHHTGFLVFPDFKTSWHFDDKVGQKYLFERLEVPFVPSYVFFDKKTALSWIQNTNFPKVFKLRGGAGSKNVKLIKSTSKARKLVKTAFGSGFSNYDSWESLEERYRKWRIGQTNFFDVIKGILRFISPPLFTKIAGKEMGYIYFQDFIPNNNSDTRIIVIDNKAFALKRYVRKNDFRASGSGFLEYAKEVFDERCVKISFEVTQKMGSQCAAFDFVFDLENNPLLVEVSYGFRAEGYDSCPGYWDKDLIWHEGNFNPQGWMIDSVLNKIQLS